SEKTIDYLALGDSYSSGRGDIGMGPNGQSYYTSASRGPNNCHISTRSFPFLLKRFNNVADDRMRSVACAGARLNNDFYGPNDNYFGQSDQLKTKNATEVSQMRKLAIDEFLPGIVKQLEFVKTTKPKVVTVTAGGNDVGFADIILSCITSPGISHRMSTCDEATTGSFKSNLVGDAIQSQFKLTKQLIAELKSISPTTTTYVVGYPKFIADDAKRCLNTMMLNQHEMKAINAAVSYMNRVLASAAKAGGARFIDIENSLVGGRLCEGGEYMTGLLNFSLDTDFSEMFHPNSEGHIRMADSIQASGFVISEDNNPVAIDASVPMKPAAFGATSYVPTFAQKLLPEAMIVAGGANPLLIAADGIFNNADTVTFTLHSNPVKLGTFTAQADGSINATISVPLKTDPGVHMLVADVVSSDGSKKRYFQYIEVKSPRTDDRDGDGILDSVDSCLYVKYWYDEQSGKDVCTTVTSGSMPGRGFGHGYGHLISNGLHTGHGGHASSLVP
ncbi:MAG: SGNH/GDSL hydrolase family protein, partial [Candidatus Saccharimonadales bacterium]